MKSVLGFAGVGLVAAVGFVGFTMVVGLVNPSPEIRVMASDFRYDASQTTFVAGRPYHFVVTNDGSLSHDWVIAPRGAAEEDALVMVEDDDFQPGTMFTKDFIFTQPGLYEIACHFGQHYELGMVLPITVN